MTTSEPWGISESPLVQDGGVFLAPLALQHPKKAHRVNLQRKRHISHENIHPIFFHGFLLVKKKKYFGKAGFGIWQMPTITQRPETLFSFEKK